ncbi:hypothetical protein [Desulfovibrio sp. SGI.133]|uniref:hypothetical protein n=1 Tax=Desulfovibrio sp. SGI.133 TaxID=3420560 RepID=UPI003D07FA9B
MNKILLLVVSACLLLCPLSASAQGKAPSRAEVLVMKDNLLVLWSMGLMKSAPKSQEALCRDALFFLILAEGSACGVDRHMAPDHFQGIAENYEGFVPKQKVEEAARTIFGQEVTQHVASRGTYFDGNGYFLDFSVLSDKTGNTCNLSPVDLLPGYANLEVMEPTSGNNWEMFGRLQRFKEVDGGEILWREAVFRVTVQLQDGKLLLRSFEFTEQPMG